MPRPVSVSNAYEILLAQQEQREPRPEYVVRNAELVPAKGDCEESRPGTVTEIPNARRVHVLDDEHSLIDEYEVE